MSQKQQNVFLKNKNVSKRDIRINNYAVLGHFGPFWAVLGHFMSQIRQNLFLENKNVRFWDIKHFIAPPENGKTFFRKIRMCDFGTSNILLHPLKKANHFFGK